MQKIIPLLGLSTALIFSASALAHDEDYDEDSIYFQRVGEFADVDANSDGKISEQEYLAFEEEDLSERGMKWRQGHWAEMIEKFDANDDNQIESEEINDYIETRLAEVMDKLEGLHGKFELKFGDDSEFSSRLERHLGELDEHIARAMERVHDHEILIESFDLDGNDFILNPGPGFVFAWPHLNDMKNLDENEDGEITMEEFSKSREKMFERLDKNGDGVLSGEELEGMHLKGDFAFEWVTREEEDE
ncbi:MAG: hypothetical protein V3R20_00780 [Sphingomonadales bacterium]